MQTRDLPISVLLIDDDEDDFYFIRSLLSNISWQQFKLEWLSDYDSALAALMREPFDVCLIDYRLGQKSGLDLLKEAKDSRAPFILLTGYGDYQVDVEAMKSGAADYLSKGDLNATILERSIRYAIERASAKELLRKAYDEREAAALKESEQRLRRAELVAHFGHWELDLDSGMVTASDGAKVIYGITGEAWPLTDIKRITLSEYRGRIDKALEELVERGKPFDIEFKVCRPIDGKVLDINSIAEFSPEKRRIFGVIQDITEWKKAELALAEEAVRRRILFEQSRDGIVVLDLSGRVREANPKFAGMLGYSMEELLRLHVWDWDVQLGRGELEEMLRLVGPAGGHYETRHKRKDGSFYDVEISSNAIEWRESKLISCLCHDISERKAAEDAIRESEEKYRTLYETMAQGVVYHGRDGEILDANPAAQRILGMTLDQMRSRSFTDPHWKAIHEDGSDFPGDAHPSMIALRTGEDVRDVVMGVFDSRHGGRRWINIHAVPQFRTGDELPYQVYTTLEDITARKMADRELRQSEEQYRTLFEETTEGIVLADYEKGEIVDCNQAFLDLSGYERSDLIGKPQTILHLKEESSSGVSKTFSQHRGEMSGSVLISDLVCKSGATKHVEIKGSPLVIGGRRILHGFFRDITEQMQYHHERETTLQLLRLLNDDNNTRELIRNLTGFLQRWTGCEAVGVRLREGDDFPYFETQGFPGRFVEAEKFLCARDPFGEVVRDAAGNPVLECMCGNVLRGRFDPVLPFFTPKGSFWTNSTTELLGSTTEEDRQARTRNRCHGEGYESVALIPLKVASETLGLLQINDRNKNKFTPELIIFLENAADQIAMALSQRRSKAALRISEQRFRDVIEAAGEFIWEVDKGRRFTYLSERVEKVLGFKPEELIGKQISMLFDESGDSERQFALDERAWVKEGFREFEHSARTKSGSLVWLSASAFPILDPAGRLLGFRGATLDITERKQAEREKARLESQLRHAQKLEAIGTLAGGIAHDFNNILSPIIGYTEMALEDIPESSPTRYDLKQVLTAGMRARDLVKQILSFSRAGGEPIMRPIDVKLIVKEALKLLRASLPSSIEIRQELETGVALADATQIHQVIVNLCTNAAHAMGDKGILEVSFRNVHLDVDDLIGLPDLTGAPGPFLKLGVADTGHGMDGVTMRRIFDPYFTTKEVGKGTGLGLAVVHGIVKQHDGAITVRSQPGKGSVFEVYLPIAKVEPKALIVATEELPRGSEHVLLVDDERMITDMVSRMLEQLGYKVTAKTSSLEAFNLFRSRCREFDLIITDYTMPEMTGIDLAKEALKVRADIPIILCTGFNEKVTLEEVRSMGIREFLMKPLDRRELAKLVRSVFDS